MKLYFVYLLFILGLISTACGKKKSDASTGFSITGSWATICYKTKDNINYELNTITINDTNLVNTVFLYDAIDSNCATKLQTLEATSNYIVIGDANGIENGKKINLTLQKMIVTLNNAADVSTFNSVNLYSQSNWVINTPVDITDQHNTLIDPNIEFVKNAIDYNLIHLIDPVLTFGDESGSYNGTSEAKRPVTMSAKDGQIFIKK